MKIRLASLSLLAVLLMWLAPSLRAGHGLRFVSPADDSDRGWEQQSLPIGCGHFGANVFGNVTNERVQVTHNALHNVDPQNPKKSNLTDALEIRLRTDTGDGEHAYRIFGNLLGERIYDNLWDAHPPFQIDGNFGGTAADFWLETVAKAVVERKVMR